MRILFAFALVASLAACGAKKKSATTPPPASEATEKSDDSDMKPKDSPDADDDAAPETKSADPQEGGQ